MSEVRKTDGEPFSSKAALASVLAKSGITDSHNMIEKDDGWVGIPKPNTIQGPKLIKCRVHRSNCDPDNKDMPISITVNSITNKKTFWPGEEVELSESHIAVLKDSVEEVCIPIPLESGIYSSADPVALAKNFYPAMQAVVNKADNTISMISKTPNYIVERL